MAIGFVAMNSYAIADTYFVGQLGTLPLAAMGFTFPVAFAMISVGLGVGIATSSIVARLLGAGNRETVQRIVTHAIILGFVLGVMLLAIGLGTMEPMFRALGADERTLPLIGQYMRVYYFGSAFVILPMVGNFAIRATGNALAPSLIMVFAALTNIVLDPLLIFGLLGFPRLELAGAAIATVVSNVATVAASMAVLYYRERLILPRYLRLKGLWDSWKPAAPCGYPRDDHQPVSPGDHRLSSPRWLPDSARKPSRVSVSRHGSNRSSGSSFSPCSLPWRPSWGRTTAPSSWTGFGTRPTSPTSSSLPTVWSWPQYCFLSHNP